jgi:hypothetical protein
MSRRLAGAGCRRGRERAVGPTLILVGIGCIIAAIIGGGVKLVQLEIAKFDSGQRQMALGILGIVLFLAGLTVQLWPSGYSSPRRSETQNEPETQHELKTQNEPERKVREWGGEWVSQNNVRYDIVQEGAIVGVTAYRPRGEMSGSGAIQGFEISFDLGSGHCSGDVLESPQRIEVTCTEPGRPTQEIRLKRPQSS